jgi:hypothetical protein
MGIGEWESGNGNGEWERGMGNGNGNGEWERGMGTEVGTGNGNANGNHKKTSFKKTNKFFVCLHGEKNIIYTL